MRSGHRLCSCSTVRAKSVCHWRVICPTTISSLLYERSRSHRFRTQELRRCGTMVRRRGHPLWGFPFCAGGDVLAPSRTTRRATITRCWAKSPRNSARRTRPAFGLAKRFRGCIREATYQSECGDQRLHAHERHCRNAVVFAFPIGLRNCDLAERSSQVIARPRLK